MSYYTVAKGLFQFWSSFGVDAYIEDHVPDDAVLPYITYELKEPYWNSVAYYTARVWTRGESIAQAVQLVDKISTAIGGGKRIKLDDGYLVLFKEENFVQTQPDSGSDEHVTVEFLSMTLQAFTKENNA